MPPTTRSSPWRARAAWWRAAASLLLAPAVARDADPPRRAPRPAAAPGPEEARRAGPPGLAEAAAAARSPGGSAGGPAPLFWLGGPAPAGLLLAGGGPPAPAPAPGAAAVHPDCPCREVSSPLEVACDCDQAPLYEAVLNVTQEEFAAIGGSAVFQAQEWRQRLREAAWAQLELGDEALSRVAQQESLATQREAEGVEARELLAARQMGEAVQDARARAVPAAVDEFARAWAGNLSRNAAARAVEPAVQAAVEDVRSASELQGQAVHHAQTAALLERNLTGLAEAVQGARPAMDGLVLGFLANYSGAVGAAARRLAHVSDTSEGSAELAYRTALEARDTARASLDRSKAAEQSALEALARSRANAGRIARLRSRMAKVLEEEQANEAAADAASSLQ